MTSREAIKLAKRIERWQGILSPLGVGHFRIEEVSVVDETPGGPRANATVHTAEHYDSCHFWFKHEYVDEAEERDIDITIIHEWLHVAMRDLDHALEVVESWMPDQTYSDFEESVDHEREGFIERLARTIYALHSES